MPVFSLLIIFGFLSAAEARTGSFPAANYDESKVPAYRLPELLVSQNGTRITTPEEWEKLRRPEVLKLFHQFVYGQQPERPPELKFEVVSDALALHGKARRKQIHIHITGKATGPVLHLLLYVPVKRVTGFPVFLGLNFKGNHTIDPDPGILINEGTKNHARGSRARDWPVGRIIRQGYGLATLYYGDIVQDWADGLNAKVPALYPELQKGSDNFNDSEDNGHSVDPRSGRAQISVIDDPGTDAASVGATLHCRWSMRSELIRHFQTGV